MPMSRISAKVIFCGRSVMAHHSVDQATSEADVALERQNNIDNNIDNGSAESSCNDPHRRIEPVLGGLGFKRHLTARAVRSYARYPLVRGGPLQQKLCLINRYLSN